ncbi:protein-disulfide reductase DsbD [Kaistia terrae]|uniref:Protein-disulfide reductase DsbD n=1 Tax=Kaistia terrae TaxID=537017 RepID=A0ABW0PSP0_9HYPH|nr:protein-disulfide reductase DsbD [Kaistia terrae]MCX5577791.1 protein-disulfide reductase DsbD [Kaistia terrae]
MDPSLLHFPSIRGAVLRALALVALLVLAALPAGAQSPPSADAVFALTASRDTSGDLKLGWTIADGNYLYRDKIGARDAAGTALPVTTPAGEMKDDPNFGPTEVYHREAEARIAAADLGDGKSLTVTFQGCAEAGICYPPAKRTVDLATLAVSAAGPASLATGFAMPKFDASPFVDEAEPASETTNSPIAWIAPDAPAPNQTAATPLMAGNPVVMLAAFLGFGLLLALTPCVFPMIPILSGIIARSGAETSAKRGFALSLAYVLAMAAAYALLGVVAAWSGQNLQAALQTPWALGLMSLVLVALALSMFGLYELQAPAFLTRFLQPATGGTGGSLMGAALLGFGSALIVGPCVTPPLAAALLYVSQTGDVARGASALFALGLGMGLPLIAVGTFGAGILPRAGPWLGRIKGVFGVIFLGLAIEMAGRVLPGSLTLGLWALLAIGTGVALTASPLSQRPLIDHPRRTLGFAALVYGAVLIIGASAGAEDPLRPLAVLTEGRATAVATPYETATRVTSLAAMDAAIGNARQQGRPIFVSFTADWCTVCKTNDRTVFRDPEIVTRLARASLIVADVTDTTAETQALMQRYDVVGPPTMLLIDPQTGREIDGTRSIGATTTAAFGSNLRRAGV